MGPMLPSTSGSGETTITILSVGVVENEISLILIFCKLADATSMQIINIDHGLPAKSVNLFLNTRLLITSHDPLHDILGHSIGTLHAHESPHPTCAMCGVLPLFVNQLIDTPNNIAELHIPASTNPSISGLSRC